MEEKKELFYGHTSGFEFCEYFFERAEVVVVDYLFYLSSCFSTSALEGVGLKDFLTGFVAGYLDFFAVLRVPVWLYRRICPRFWLSDRLGLSSILGHSTSTVS